MTKTSQRKPTAKSRSQRTRTAPQGLACLILAAGKGTRMNSTRTKVLHTLLGVPLVSYAVQRARDLGASPIVAVLGHQRDEVARSIADRHGEAAVTVVDQVKQQGTGHAVRLGMLPLADWEGTVLILCGDVPLLQTQTLQQLVARQRASGGLVMLSARVSDATGYGRVIRDRRGRVKKIVEHRDASTAERRIDEINAGIYAMPAGFLRDAVAHLRADNAQGEYYLTDVIPEAVRKLGALAMVVDAMEVAGINQRTQLVAAEQVQCRRLIDRWTHHATFRDPDSTRVDPEVEIGPDVEIGRGVSLRGRTKIGAGTRIDDGVILTDTDVGPGVEIRPYCVANQARIGAGCQVGPFAHLRPGTDLGPDVHVGNFVETKQAKIGRGSKANHLSYLGDVVVGERVNVGAGTITCNYDGYRKYTTVIEDGAFIGSDTQLVAPVRVGKRAVVAAGTTVTVDVPEGALAISRVEQSHRAGYADRRAAKAASSKVPSMSK